MKNLVSGFDASVAGHRAGAKGGLFARVAAWFAERARRADARRRLNALDDRMLSDIGVDRADIAKVVRKGRS